MLIRSFNDLLAILYKYMSYCCRINAAYIIRYGVSCSVYGAATGLPLLGRASTTALADNCSPEFAAILKMGLCLLANQKIR